MRIESETEKPPVLDLGCQDCGLEHRDEPNSRSLARKHVRETGHEVNVWNRTITVYRPREGS